MTEQQNQGAASTSSRPVWTRPAVTRIEMKRTLNAPGSGRDFTHKSLSFGSTPK